MNMPLVLLNRRRRGFTAFSPSTLFSTTAIGIWLDPSDVANLAWRRNLLTYSEQFDNSVWLFARGTKGAAQTDPNGGMTAIRFTATSANADIYQSYVGANVAYVGSIYVRRVSGSGVVEMFPPSLAGGTAIALTSDWQRFSRTSLPSGGATAYMGVRMVTSGDVIDVAFGQLEFGTVATDYQRISDVNTEVIERFPTATMFSDRAGTTPVTAPGTVVGLRLDKSKGLTLGSELVTNGDFASGTTGWTVDSPVTLTVSGGQAAIARNSGTISQFPRQAIVTAGKWYRVTFTVIARSHNVQVYLQDTAAISTFIISATGTFTVLLLAGSADSLGLRIGPTGDFAATCTIDNISVSELPGNHAVAPTDAARPIYGVEPKGGRRNLLLQTEGFDTASWGKDSCTIAANTVLAPDGTTTADRIVSAAATAQTGVGQSATTQSGAAHTASYYVQANGARYVQLLWGGSTSGNYANFDLQTVTVTGGIYTAATITAAANGFYRITITSTVATTLTGSFLWLVDSGTVVRGGSYTGNGTSGIYVWGAQLELGSTASNYQRVTTAYDVTEAGVATTHYVQYDGSDDSMSTAAIDFTATDKMSVFAGVRKLSDAAMGAALGLSTNPPGTAGAIELLGPAAAAANDYRWTVRGTSTSTMNPAGFVAPVSNVLTGIADISGDLATLRANGSVAATSASDLGTGNFGNHPIFIGRRNNATLPFNGKDYGIIIVGKAASAGEITDTETWLATRTAQVTI